MPKQKAPLNNQNGHQAFPVNLYSLHCVGVLLEREQDGYWLCRVYVGSYGNIQ
jgi:hypothetical protein